MNYLTTSEHVDARRSELLAEARAHRRIHPRSTRRHPLRRLLRHRP